MRMKIYSCLLAFVLCCNVSAEKKHKIIRQKDSVTLPCPHPVEGKVTWSREKNGNRVDILTVDGDRDIRHIHDPLKRYSSSADKSLHISRAAVSDAGTYFCNNEAAVELTVLQDHKELTTTTTDPPPPATTSSPPPPETSTTPPPPATTSSPPPPETSTTPPPPATTSSPPPPETSTTPPPPTTTSSPPPPETSTTPPPPTTTSSPPPPETSTTPPPPATTAPSTPLVNTGMTTLVLKSMKRKSVSLYNILLYMH
ncbi:proline-rich receptor-like protein kinase PERK8 isoform X3 [Micropterus salmoides]|uniref:proline-rich receptor-like protein kinase PERK8 isoform X3 n=1 Tax=Micropterus salmoides TaxID=27706 RepID=UPI0018EB3382|nr:proline-rich receptor-like protein kinase PERK8 isoform X3 [Micropterus salmoides]